MRIVLCAFLYTAGCGMATTSSHGEVDGSAFAAHGAASAVITVPPTPIAPSGGSIFRVLLSELDDPCGALSSPDGGAAVADAKRLVITVQLGLNTTPALRDCDADGMNDVQGGNYWCSALFLYGDDSEFAYSGAMHLRSFSGARGQGSFQFTFGSHGELTGTFDAPRCEALEELGP